MVDLFWLLLPVAACSGWVAANKNKTTSILNLKSSANSFHFNQKYITGLNFILNDETDKALDVFLELFSVDNDTVETHMALGSLFRRRGEVERALRIHQNVIARPNLCAEQRLNGMIELGYDYLCAGVLDRAENIFKDIVKQYPDNYLALKYLLDIYQQQRDWQSAIDVALLLQFNSDCDYSNNIAHYYCELMLAKKQEGNFNEAHYYIKQALKYQHANARANLLLADLYVKNQQFRKGTRIYQELAQNIKNHPEIILPLLVKTYEKNAANRYYDLFNFLNHLADKYPQIFAVSEVVSFFMDYKGYDYTCDLVSTTVVSNPKLKVIANLIELLGREQFTSDKNYNLLHNSMGKLLANTKNYKCQHCGFKYSELLWLCPSCKTWDTIFHIDFNE